MSRTLSYYLERQYIRRVGGQCLCVQRLNRLRL